MSRRFYTSTVKCSICGTQQPITRRYRRAAGHIKHTWCRVCQERTAHIELEEGNTSDNTCEQFSGEQGT